MAGWLAATTLVLKTATYHFKHVPVCVPLLRMVTWILFSLSFFKDILLNLLSSVRSALKKKKKKNSQKRKKGRKEGRKEGRKGGKKEGRKYKKRKEEEVWPISWCLFTGISDVKYIPNTYFTVFSNESTLCFKTVFSLSRVSNLQTNKQTNNNKKRKWLDSTDHTPRKKYKIYNFSVAWRDHRSTWKLIRQNSTQFNFPSLEFCESL